MSISKRCLAFTGLFEAEVLTELLLRFWGHPLAANREYRNSLLETAAETLRLCLAGQKVIEDLPARETNFIAAIWYAEWVTLENGEGDPQGQRREWLEKVRKALPSCFCPLDQLQ